MCLYYIAKMRGCELLMINYNVLLRIAYSISKLHSKNVVKKLFIYCTYKEIITKTLFYHYVHAFGKCDNQI